MTSRITWIAFICAAATFAGCGDDDRPAMDSGVGDGATSDGSSGCPSGTEMCDSTCVDTRNDRANCGGCGMACDVGQACVDGACGVVCPGGQIECGGACANTQTDRDNCGACATACGSGEICADGDCVISCAEGSTLCGAVCADTNSNPAHCGGCDMPCDAGEVCSEGACATSCGAGLMDCGGACVDLQNNPAYCGACDVSCASPTGATGVCVAGSCGALCEPLTGDCNGDLASSTGDGCETGLATDPANCGACNLVCGLDNAVSGCDAGACVVTTCDTGFEDCDSMDATGCEAELATDEANCGACGTTCAATEVCVSGSCIDRYGENCAEAYPLSPGANTIAWTASMADYLTTSPSCVSSSYSLEGPDVVLSYTATSNERVTLDFTKPTNTRWGAVVSTETCGTMSPATACISDYGPASMAGSFVLDSGETAYVYVRDTSSGTAPLDNPLMVNVTAVSCTDVPPVTLDPPSGGPGTRVPTFTATFGAPVISSSGVITITGTMGTSETFDLSTSPSEVSFSSGNTVMTINLPDLLPTGEVLTISWTGLRAVVCTTPIDVPAPTWQVTVPPPPCGDVGGTVTRIPTGLTSSLVEYYVVPDESPTGYVYFGGTSDLFRVPKAGGTAEDIYDAAGLTSSNLGYDMLLDGDDIYTVESKTSGTTDHLFRISTDGGATWSRTDYATFPSVPEDNFQTAVLDGGRIYLLTNEFYDTDNTEIWSVPAASSTVPTTAVRETTFTAEEECAGMAMDSTYYYIACWQDDRLIRLNRTTGALTLITDQFDIQISGNKVIADDTDGDGTADVLYLQLGREEVVMVCEPDSSTPTFDTLARWGTSSGNYGLGFDRTAGSLWAIDDDTRELILIQ